MPQRRHTYYGRESQGPRRYEGNQSDCVLIVTKEAYILGRESQGPGRYEGNKSDCVLIATKEAYTRQRESGTRKV